MTLIPPRGPHQSAPHPSVPGPSPLPLLPVGPRARLVEVGDADLARALAEHLRAAGVADDVVPAASTVLLDGLDQGRVEEVGELLAAWAPDDATSSSSRLVEVVTTYDGADLDAVADHWGTDRAGVLARHQEVEFRSAFCGFAPGFAYLTGLPDALAVPRLDRPRTRVPAGSVALAGRWCGVYPSASPGGWLLLGRTEAVLWDQGADPPALLAPGTRVRFVAR